MAAKRYELNDAQWRRLRRCYRARPVILIGPGNGCLWVLRSGAHWCDLPERYGRWKTVHRRFSRRCHAEVWERVSPRSPPIGTNPYLMIDSTIVRAPACGDRKRGAQDQTLGRSRGGLTTKIHMLADALGRPLRLIVTAGQVGDVTEAPALLEDQAGDAVLADKAYDSNALSGLIANMRAEAVIPSNRTRKVLIPHDPSLTITAIASSDASDALSISAASPPATIDAPSTSSASHISPP